MGVQALQARAGPNHRRAPGDRENESEGHCGGLNDAGIPTARGGKWSSPQVMRMLERLDPFREEEAAAA